MGSEIYLTKDGRNKLIGELENLKKRKVVTTEEMSRAREHGDLKENAEYHAAKETLTNIAKRIAEIESKLSNVKIIEEQNLDSSKVYIGVKVNLKDQDGDEYEYTIVDAEEANLSENKISIQSPLAQGLLGHEKGDKVKVKLPVGEMVYQILDISR
ncbi:MAG: transcription elongation factor GreA [Elusimicrobia bacterium]|nr:transcription elongation factor GreA [Elusimicrobiota bacterium]